MQATHRGRAVSEVGLLFHEISSIFPLMSGEPFAALVEDIRVRGVIEPVWLYEGKIIDGRNRYNAANEVGAKFETRTFGGSPLEAIEQVWSLNCARRHMTASQAAIADAKRNRLTDAYSAVRDASKARMLAGKANPQELIPEGSEKPNQQTRDIRAKAAGSNAKYIDLADKLIDERPDLVVEIEAGVKTLSQVKRDLNREKLAAQIPDVPTGKYRVLYADPPWKYNDTQAISKDGLGESYGPADAHYPPMTITELCALPIDEIAEDNAVLFLWTTSPFLEVAFKVIKAWSFKYKTSFVWDKVKHNMGHYNSVRHEFLLVCTRGSCLPDINKLFDSVQSIERTKRHSQKPPEFREIIDTIYPNGSRIELFAREGFENWTAWGNEFDAA